MKKDQSYKTDQAIVDSTHTHQERDIIRILLLAASAPMEDESGITIGEYIMESLEDSITYFEHPVYKAIIGMYENKYREEGLPEAAFFLHHDDDAIRTTAIDLLSDPYRYSHNWEERWDIVLQTQKMPEENYVKDAYLALLRLKMKKIEMVIKENSQRILTAETDEDREKHLMVHQELLRSRNHMAKELKTIVL